MKLMEAKALSTYIGKIGKAQVKLRDEIQAACLHCIGHAILHGDVTFGTRLMAAANGSIRRQGIVNYLSEHGPFTWDTSKEVFKKNTKWDKTDPKDVEKWLDTVIKDPRGPWYEFTKEAKPTPYDPLKDFESFLKRLERKANLAKDEGKVLPHSDVYDYIARAMEEYREDHEEAKKKKEVKEGTEPQPSVNPLSGMSQPTEPTSREVRSAA